MLSIAWLKKKDIYSILEGDPLCLQIKKSLPTLWGLLEKYIPHGYA